MLPEAMPSPVHTARRCSNFDLHIGAQIRHWRGLAMISQETLADRIGITYQQVQKYERGANRISAGRLLKVAHVLGVDVCVFYDGLDTDAAEQPAELSAEIASIIADPDGAELVRAICAAGAEQRHGMLLVARSLAHSNRRPPAA